MSKEKIQKDPPAHKGKCAYANQVEVQLGKIDPNPMTSKQMKFSQKVEEARETNAMRRRCQTLDLHMPKN
jgi:hypothetical protein